jgi:hypothetical protein
VATTKDPRIQALEGAMEQGNRVRLLIGERKMRLPGVVARGDDGNFQLRANWGRTYDVPLDDTLREVEVADGSGRYQPVSTA